MFSNKYNTDAKLDLKNVFYWKIYVLLKNMSIGIARTVVKVSNLSSQILDL